MKIEELKEDIVNSFDGVILHSYMLADRCMKCYENLWYDYRFDASFCPHCNEWVECPTDMNVMVNDSDSSCSNEEKEKYPLAKAIPEKPLNRPKGVMPEDDYHGSRAKEAVTITVYE